MSESEELAAQLAQLQKRLTKAERDYNRCREDKDEVEERYKAEIQQKEKEHARAVKKEKSRADRSDAELKEQITNIQGELDDVKERGEGYQRQYATAQQKLNDATQELSKTKTQIQALEADVQQAEKEGIRQLNRVKNEKAALQTRLAELEVNFQREIDQTKKDHDRNFTLFTEEKTKSDAHFNERVDRLHKELVEREAQIAELHARAERSAQELKTAEAAHQATKDATARLIDNHAAALADTNKETERVRSEKDALILQIESISKSNTESLAANEERYQSILQVTKDEWKADQAERENRITDLTTQLESAKAIVAESSQQLDAMATEKDVQARSNTELQKEISALKAAHERTVADLRASNERSLNEKSVLADEIKTLHRKFAEDLQKHRQHAQEDVDRVLEEKKTSDGDFQSQIDMLLAQISDFEKRALEADAKHVDELKSVQATLSEEKGVVTQLKAEKAKSDVRFDKFRQQYERRINKMSKHHDEVVANLRTEKDRQISVLETELEANKENLLDQMRAAATLAVEIDSLNAAHQTEIEDLQSQSQLVRLEKSKLEAQLVKQREEQREAVVKLEERYRENEEVFNAHKLSVEEAHQQRLEELSQKIHEAEERLINSDEALQEARQQLAVRESDIASFELQRQALEASKNAEVETLERELLRWKDESKVAREQISASKTAYERDLAQAAEEYQNHLRVVIDEKKAADSKFEARLDELTNAYNEAQRENSGLKIKMNEVYAKTETLLKQSKRDSTRTQSEKQVLLDRLEAQEDLSKTQRNSMQIEHEAAVDRLQKQLEKVHAEEDAKIGDLTQNISNLELELSNARSESKELKSLFEKSKLDHALLTIDKKDLAEANEKLAAELRHANVVSAEKQSTLRERLGKAKVSHEEEIKHVQNEFKNTLKAYDESREGMKQRIASERDDLNQKIADLSANNSELADKVENANQEVETLGRRVEALNEQAEIMNKANTSSQSDAKGELNRVRNERDALHRERELTKQRYEENMKSAKEQWDRQMKDFRKDKDQLNSANAAVEKWKYEVENERKQYESLQQKFDQALESFNKEMRKVNSQQSELASAKQQADRDNVSLRAELAELNRQLSHKSEEQLQQSEKLRMLQFQVTNTGEHSVDAAVAVKAAPEAPPKHIVQNVESSVM